MGVVASSGIFSGTNTCIAPGEAHLWFTVFVLASALTLQATGESWMVARDGVFAELALVLPANPVMGELP